MQATGRAESRELAHRITSDIKVSLLWQQHDNALTVRMVEIASGREYEFSVPLEDALDAYYHPHTYRPSPTVNPSGLRTA
jgi:hypothetical protein